MGVIVRPTKASSGTQEYIPATTILDNEVDDDLNTIYAEFNGKISAGNIDPSAAIPASCLADHSILPLQLGNGSVTTPAVLAKNITSALIANDPTVDASRAITSDHIKNNAIIARTVKVTTIDWSPGGTIAAGAEIHNSTLLDRTTALIPLFFEVRTNVDPPAGTGNTNALVLKLWLNTSSNTYFMSVSNPTASLVSIASYTFRFYYIPIS